MDILAQHYNKLIIGCGLIRWMYRSFIWQQRQREAEEEPESKIYKLLHEVQHTTDIRPVLDWILAATDPENVLCWSFAI